MNFRLACWLICLTGVLSGCASLQPQIDNVSVQSYEQGCTLRGIQNGLKRENAQAVCRCHVNKAIAQTSQDSFLQTTEYLANASEQDKQSEKFKESLALMRETFNECKVELGIE